MANLPLKSKKSFPNTKTKHKPKFRVLCKIFKPEKYKVSKGRLQKHPEGGVT